MPWKSIKDYYAIPHKIPPVIRDGENSLSHQKLEGQEEVVSASESESWAPEAGSGLETWIRGWPRGVECEDKVPHPWPPDSLKRWR